MWQRTQPAGAQMDDNAQAVYVTTKNTHIENVLFLLCIIHVTKVRNPGWCYNIFFFSSRQFLPLHIFSTAAPFFRTCFPFILLLRSFSSSSPSFFSSQCRCNLLHGDVATIFSSHCRVANPWSTKVAGHWVGERQRKLHRISMISIYPSFGKFLIVYNCF